MVYTPHNTRGRSITRILAKMSLVTMSQVRCILYQFSSFISGIVYASRPGGLLANLEHY